MYSDAYLNHYADRFVELRLARHGLSLDQYLANPRRYEPLALEPEDLLPQQQEVAQRLSEAELAKLERPLEDMPRRNGAIVEPLHRRRHHKHSTAAFFSRGGRW